MTPSNMNPMNYSVSPNRARIREARNRFATLVLVAVLTTLAGCVDAPTPRMDRAASLPAPAPRISADDSGALENAPPPKQPPMIHAGTGQTINAGAAASPGVDNEGSGETTFNFEGESVHAVVKAILGDLLQKNYVIAPGVQGTVTLSTPHPVNASQALSLLEMVLGWNNARMVWADGRYNIVPADQALTTGNLGPRTSPIGGVRGYEVRAVPLQFISATEMEKLLKPYARTGAIVSADSARNLIVLAGTRAELENYQRTVQIFDVDWLAGMSVGVYPLQQTDAARMVTSLEKAFGENSKTPIAGMFRFMPLEGINAVLVITPQPKYLTEIQAWIDRLDQGDGQTPRLYVYEVKNIKATDLSNQLGTLYGNAAPQQAPQVSTMPGLEPVEVTTYSNDKNGIPSTAQAMRNAADAIEGRQGGSVGNAGSSGQGSGSVSITAVEDSNSILVRATPAQWESIRRAIDRLDAMPLQVHIEAQVVEVKLTGDLAYGVSWYFQNAIPDPTLRNLAATRHSLGPIAGSILPSTDPANPGASWTFLGHNTLAVIHALDSITNVRVLSAPSLVVRNNSEADFNSGTQIPVASTIFNPNGGSNPIPDQNNTISQVQFRQTGVSLKVKPRVASNGMVFMDITQDVSSPSASGPTIAGNISVDNRKIKTSVAVESGETVVLAGLIKQTSSVGSGGVPYLSRLPVIGSLFGTQSKNDDREEVLVLVTPTVIRDPTEARRLTDEYGSRFRALEPLRQPPKAK